MCATATNDTGMTEGDAKVRWFEGNYEEYEAARRRELGDAAVENRRARFRKLPRVSWSADRIR
jgi:hypothetical protein